MQNVHIPIETNMKAFDIIVNVELYTKAKNGLTMNGKSA